jgi:hypothetical protein
MLWEIFAIWRFENLLHNADDALLTHLSNAGMPRRSVTVLA